MQEGVISLGNNFQPRRKAYCPTIAQLDWTKRENCSSIFLNRGCTRSRRANHSRFTSFVTTVNFNKIMMIY